MSRKLILVPFALALLLVATHGSAVNQAACNLYPVDADSAGEDVDLFTNQGGVPNVMFLLDNSGSINRMAPDGAVNTWGSFGSTYGCGNNAFADALRYHSPCSGTTKESMPYDAATDYADIAKVCPYLDTGNKIQTGAPGFDPDVASTFFPKASVFHDNDYSSGGGGAFGGAYLAASCDTIATTTEATRCKGFEENGAAAAATSTATFCANWKQPSNVALTAAQLTDRRTSCNTCLSTKGYWYSGYYYRNNWMQDDPLGADGTSPMACGNTQWCSEHALGICVDRATKMTEYSGGDRSLGVCRMPHLYFSGNFLNFQPPKFIVLRKVLKDVLMDVKRVRLGLTTFNTGGTGGTLVWKLNPSCNQVFPPSQSSFDSNRSSLLGQIKAVNFNTSTPLAETLLNVGQYYRSSGLPWFNSTYQNSGFNPGNGANQASVCFSCQKSSIIVVTDGLSNNDSAIPGTDFAADAPTYDDSIATGAYAGMAGFNIKGIDATTCPLCNTEDEAPEDGLHPAGEIPLTNCDSVNAKHGACNTTGPAATHLPTDNYLPKVAWYLHHFDTQQDTVKGADCAVMKDHQDLDIYTIGYGLTGNAARILAHTAYRDPGGDPKKDVGGGLAYSASDAHELRQAILDIFNDVNTRSTTFGGASIANVTAAANIDTQIPRFEPSKAAHWEGHLYKFNLWSEFSAGCKPTLPGQPFDTKDVDCDRKCESVFLKDSLESIHPGGPDHRPLHGQQPGHLGALLADQPLHALRHADGILGRSLAHLGRRRGPQGACLDLAEPQRLDGGGPGPERADRSRRGPQGRRRRRHPDQAHPLHAAGRDDLHHAGEDAQRRRQQRRRQPHHRRPGGRAQGLQAVRPGPGAVPARRRRPQRVQLRSGQLHRRSAVQAGGHLPLDAHRGVPAHSHHPHVHVRSSGSAPAHAVGHPRRPVGRVRELRRLRAPQPLLGGGRQRRDAARLPERHLPRRRRPDHHAHRGALLGQGHRQGDLGLRAARPMGQDPRAARQLPHLLRGRDRLRARRLGGRQPEPARHRHQGRRQAGERVPHHAGGG